MKVYFTIINVFIIAHKISIKVTQNVTLVTLDVLLVMDKGQTIVWNVLLVFI